MAVYYQLKDSIPGVTGKSVPGNGRLKTPRNVGRSSFMSGVPRQPSSSRFREYHRQQIRNKRGRFAGGWGFAWQGLEVVDSEIVAASERIHANLHRGAEALKDEMVAWAKDNAPWMDHPGVHEDARDHLQGQVVWQDAENFTIMLGHGEQVYYGLWLEVRWGGRYAIIVPTVEHFMQEGIGRRLVAGI